MLAGLTARTMNTHTFTMAASLSFQRLDNTEFTLKKTKIWYCCGGGLSTLCVRQTVAVYRRTLQHIDRVKGNLFARFFE